MTGSPIKNRTPGNHWMARSTVFGCWTEAVFSLGCCISICVLKDRESCRLHAVTCPGIFYQFNLCVCVAIWVCARVCWGQRRQDFSLNLDLECMSPSLSSLPDRLAACKPHRSSCLCPHSTSYRLMWPCQATCMGAEDPNSDPHACVQSPLTHGAITSDPQLGF